MACNWSALDPKVKTLVKLQLNFPLVLLFKALLIFSQKLLRNGMCNMHRKDITLVLRRRTKDQYLAPRKYLLWFFPSSQQCLMQLNTWYNLEFPASRTRANSAVSVQSLLPFLGGA